MHWASARRLVPTAIDNAALHVFAAFMAGEALHRRPRKVHRTVCRLWNRARLTVPGWPGTTLVLPNYRRTMSLPWSTFPDSFLADTNQWLDLLAGEDLLAADVPERPLRPATLYVLRARVRQFASGLVLSGTAPAELSSLADLVTGGRFRQGLAYLLDRAGGAPTPGTRMAATMLGIARHRAQLPEAELAPLRQLARRLNCRPRSLTERNRAILRQFDDPLNVTKLCSLCPRSSSPARVVSPSPRARRPHGADGPGDRARAVRAPPARQPGRPAPRSAHRLEPGRAARHGAPRHPGRGGQERPAARLRAPPASAAKLLNVYLRAPPASSAACGRASWLFPGARDGHKHQVTLAAQMVGTIRKELGLRLTVHNLPRTWPPSCSSTAHPGAFGLVSRLLGHSSVQTTMDFYSSLDSAAAGRLYDAEVLRSRAGAAARNAAAPAWSTIAAIPSASIA